MINRDYGGTVPPVPAANEQLSQHQYTPALTHDDLCEQLRALGFEHIERVPSSGNARIPARGKPLCNRSAWVSWSDDMQAVHWYDWTTGEGDTIFANNEAGISPAEARRLFELAERRRKQAHEKQKQLNEQTAIVARKLWADGYASGDHSYVYRKQLTALHGARIDAVTGALMIPMWVSGIGLVNLQMIDPDGSKRFIAGGRVAGAYTVVGSLNGAKRVLVAEGWATGASLHEYYGLPVVVAMSAGNLMAVCQSLRSRFEHLTVVVAGDDDRQSEPNKGRKKAIEAATAIGAKLAWPTLCRCCKCTDHNDAIICARRCCRG